MGRDEVKVYKNAKKKKKKKGKNPAVLTKQA